MGFTNPGRNLHSRTPGKRKPKHHPTTTTTTSSSTTSSSTSSSSTSSSSSTTRKRPRRSRPPPPPPLSPLESLPAELLYRIFESSHNLSLPAASPHLTHTLNTPHLRLLHLRTHRHSPAALSAMFRLRFFTAPFLALFESRFGALDATGAALPVRLVTAPWTDERLALFGALVARGAEVAGGAREREEEEEFKLVLLRALMAGREDVARVVMGARGVRGDAECLRVAVERWGDAGLGVARMLVERGAERGVRVWRAALAWGAGGRAVVEWLLEGGAPPGEVLGELSCR